MKNPLNHQRWPKLWVQGLKHIHTSVWIFLATVFCVVVVVPAIATESPSPAFPPSIAEQATSDPATLLRQGQQLYEAGQLSEAVEVWKDAAQVAQQANDTARYVASLNYLTMAYQQLSQWDLADQAIQASLNRLENLDAAAQLTRLPAGQRLYAQALNSLGELRLAMGQPEEAIAAWTQAEVRYRQDQDVFGALGSRMNQAQALQMLGYYRQAQDQLEAIATELEEQPASELKALTLMSLGAILNVTGNVDDARTVLTEGIDVAQSFPLENDTAAALLNLGSVYQSLGDVDQAQQRYEAAGAIATSPERQLEAYLSQFRLSIGEQHWQLAQDLRALIQDKIDALSPSRMGVYAHVNFAAALMKTLPNASASDNPSAVSRPLASSRDIANLLSQAVQQAQELGDRQAESYALGELGRLYEVSGQYDWAYDLTQQALALSQAMDTPEISYRWQWQLGRIQVKQTGSGSAAQAPKEAIAAYSEAVKTLKSINRELLVTSPEFQFSFRENVEPVYRELAELLLRPGATPDDLQQVRTILEDLQLAELENFFRSACLDATVQQIDDIDPTAAVIYPLILGDRLEVILSVPGEPLQQFTTAIPQSEVDATLEQLLQSLNPIFSDQIRLDVSQQVYDWIIRPLEPTLDEHRTETLVFVLDGFLRNIPMAALHDGDRYLLEKYSIALAPGLQLVESQFNQIEARRVLSAGISEARQGFSALPGVEAEINEIAQTFPADTFLNQEFTKENLEAQLASTDFPIVHLATHGQFSSDPEQTFLLSWEDQIKVGEFESLVRARQAETSRPIELLVLSACQTASGDKQAALGLAGFAVRAGARSTLATLWSVNDLSTAQFMTQFYRLMNENPDVSKSDLLRETQLTMLQQPEYEHPFYWAPFVLVGNWL